MRLQIHASASSDVNIHGEAFLKCIQHGKLHAVVGGDARDGEMCDALLLQPLAHARAGAMTIVKEAAVTVDARIHALLEHTMDMLDIECRSELSAVSVLHAVHGPEGLGEAIELSLLEGFSAWVVRGEAAVIHRVPVLRGDDEIELRHEVIDDWEDLVTSGHGQSTAGHEVVLDVDEEEGFHGVTD